MAKTLFAAGFNTVNGKYCCNIQVDTKSIGLCEVRFNTVNGRYCCNLIAKDNGF